VGIEHKIDRPDSRIERIEKRLGLLDPALPGN
jgi:hypothetical protein